MAKPPALPYEFDAAAPAAPAPKPPAPAAEAATVDAPAEILDIPVDNLELSIRTANGLANARVEFVGQLVQMSEDDLLRTKNMGRKSIVELRELLGDLGLRLGMRLDGWQSPS